MRPDDEFELSGDPSPEPAHEEPRELEAWERVLEEISGRRAP